MRKKIVKVKVKREVRVIPVKVRKNLVIVKDKKLVDIKSKIDVIKIE